MTLSATAIEWAIQFVADHSDGDLFPRVAEMGALLTKKNELAKALAEKPLADLEPGPHRRFIVPKDEVSYRQATQLDPQDSIILSAIMFEFGSGIEVRRRPKNEVFSYRFSPTKVHGLYGSQSGWNDFWTLARINGLGYECILYCDIADFYNQISHHAVENQLNESSFPNQEVKWIISLLESTTAGVSRGIPIGPHAVHLIAEASLIPIDNSMVASGIKFLRYADDIVIFCAKRAEAKRTLAHLVSILDKQQRLMLQRHKTCFFNSVDFQKFCQGMIEDRPINTQEDSLLKLIKKYDEGNPYKTIFYNEISESDWLDISEESIRNVISDYINKKDIDFIRLRWFYRRLAQIGHPGAIDVTLDNIECLTPCFAGICTYFASIQSIDKNRWLNIGQRLIRLLERDEVKDSEYFRLLILSLFSRNAEINHFDSLAAMYGGSDPYAKREILLAGKMAGATDWLREFKEDFEGMDHWQKMAYLYSCKQLPRDERKFFIQRVKLHRPYDLELARWAKA